MLIAMRSKVSGILIKALFAVLVLSFAFWGIGDVFQDRATGVDVAEVGDITITQPQLAREFDRQITQFRQILGQNFDNEQAKAFGLVDRSLANLVVRALYDVYGRDLGIVVTDAHVRRVIESDPTLQANGKFDRLRLQAMLNQIRMDETSYVESVRRDIVRQWIAMAVVAGVRAPDPLVDPLYRYRNETRTAETLVIENAGMPAPAAPDEAALTAFYDAHADMFQAPEYRGITFLRLRPEDFAAQVQVTDEELQAEFEKRRSEFDQPERRTVEQIVVQDETKARAAAEKHAAGEDFAAVATEITGGPPVSLGTVERSTVVSDLSALSDAAFVTETGKTTEPIKTPLGWHILKITAIEPETKATFESVKDQLRQEVQSARSTDAMIGAANSLDEALAGGASLEDAAAAIGVAATSVAAVDQQGLGPDGKPVEALGGSPLALGLAFQTEVGQTSSLVEDPAGGFAIAQVDSSTPPATRPLAEVRDQVVAAWTAAERETAAAAKAEEVAKRLSEGEDMAKVAAEIGATPATSAAFKRDGSGADANVTPELAQKLFEVEQGKAASAPTAGGQIVGRVASIVAADPVADVAGVEALRTDLAGQIQGDLLQQFGDQLRQRIGVTTNQAAIDKLF
jgi:peptidyl-prolyl cis-trans isomerase D